MAPREQSPELAEAEKQLRTRASSKEDYPGAVWARAVAGELDRLRAALAAEKVASETFRQAACIAAEAKAAEVARLSQPAPAQPTEMERRVALWDAINEYASLCGGDPSKRISVGRMTAVAKVEIGSAPAQDRATRAGQNCAACRSYRLHDRYCLCDEGPPWVRGTHEPTDGSKCQWFITSERAGKDGT